MSEKVEVEASEDDDEKETTEVKKVKSKKASKKMRKENADIERKIIKECIWTWWEQYLHFEADEY